MSEILLSNDLSGGHAASLIPVGPRTPVHPLQGIDADLGREERGIIEITEHDLDVVRSARSPIEIKERQLSDAWFSGS